jgi:hypothetical protein
MLVFLLDIQQANLSAMGLIKGVNLRRVYFKQKNLRHLIYACLKGLKIQSFVTGRIQNKNI